MLEEFFMGRGSWVQVMPGARACVFAQKEGSFSLPLQLEPLHFETLFCLDGSVTLTRRDGSILVAGAREVLILTSLSNLSGASATAPLKGVLVAVDARDARESLNTICGLLGGLTLDTGQARRWMSSRGGCAVEKSTDWSRAVFASLERLPRSERTRWCVWKSVELLYLLSAPQEQMTNISSIPAPEQRFAQVLAETKRYMEKHLDEALTIPDLSRHACLSATTFKEMFRRLYGLPVHTWLRQRRMERAAELLRNTSLSVLRVAQSVGYGSASQFTAAFRQQYGMSPSLYRKMSELA